MSRGASMKKLARVEVRWIKKEGHWLVKSPDGTKPFKKKDAAVRWGIRVAKINQPSQLLICLKTGKYQEERTYPRSRDPKKSKG